MSLYKMYGIYAIRNKITGKVYVGKTTYDFGDRRDCHFAMLRGGYHHNKELQNDWNELGEDNFEFIVLINCVNGENEDQVNEYEMSEIKRFKDIGLSYNLHDGGNIGYYRGKHLSEETKRKIGEKNRVNMTGRHASEETKKKMSESQKRRQQNMTDEERAAFVDRMREANKGRIWSDESRKKMKGNKNGSNLTIETVREIRRLHEKEGKGFSEISKILDLKYGTVLNIGKYRRWADVV